MQFAIEGLGLGETFGVSIWPVRSILSMDSIFPTGHIETPNLPILRLFTWSLRYAGGFAKVFLRTSGRCVQALVGGFRGSESILEECRRVLGCGRLRLEGCGSKPTPNLLPES